MKNIFLKFDSVSEFHKYLHTKQPTSAFSSIFSQHSQAGSETFTHTRNWEHAEELFTYGDKDTAKKLEECGLSQTRLETKCTANRRKVQANICGFAPHVPNYIAGVPASMLNVKEVRVKEKVINVIYNISANGGASAESLLETGVKMLSAIMKIEASGVRVNIYTADISVGHNGQLVGWLCRIKNSAQHIDTLKMCYPLCNPSMLRRHSFRFTEVTDGVSSAFVGGYGGASQDISLMLKQFQMKDCRCMSYSTAKGYTADRLAEMILNGECC